MITIIPIDDIKEHTHQSTCECCPCVDFENGVMMVIHHSFDNREIYEDMGIRGNSGWRVIKENEYA